VNADVSADVDAGGGSTTSVGGRVPRVRGYVLQADEYTLNGEQAVWRLCERWICDRYGWDETDESTHDAVDNDGGKVEVKSCVWRTEAGEPGELKIWDEQKTSADKVAVIVYAPCSPPSVVAYDVLDMSDVPRDSQIVSHPTMGRVCRHALPWPTVLGLGDVRPGLRHAFQPFFDGECDEDVVVLDPPEYRTE